MGISGRGVDGRGIGEDGLSRDSISGVVCRELSLAGWFPFLVCTYSIPAYAFLLSFVFLKDTNLYLYVHYRCLTVAISDSKPLHLLPSHLRIYFPPAVPSPNADLNASYIHHWKPAARRASIPLPPTKFKSLTCQCTYEYHRYVSKVHTYQHARPTYHQDSGSKSLGSQRLDTCFTSDGTDRLPLVFCLA